ncbi:MAG: sensor histidine kinase, partial [Betaproteobacteria bacterium]
IAYLSVLAFGIATQSAKALARREALEGELIAERTARRAERDFVAMLSHELHTPLATIEASTRILQDIPGLDPAARGARYDKIVRSVGRLRDLFDRLLASDRLRADWHPTELRPLELVEFVQQVRDSSAADWPGADISFVPPQGPAMVAADRGLIGIAFGNLIGNALAYGPRDRPVLLEVSLAAHGWRVSAHDFGAPIPPAERETLFAPYVRGIRATATPGAGLGLFIVMRIARLHGGNAGLDCPEGGGNRFWFEIPAGSGRESAVTNS